MSKLAAVDSSIRFQYWFSQYAGVFEEISTNACNATLAAYREQYREFYSPTCEAHVDCMLGEASETLKAKMASAAIFLGILPSMLSMLGPSLTQLTLLTARRPFLSLLIAVGTTGFYLDRLFTVEPPGEHLAPKEDERFMPKIRGDKWGILISIIEYAAAGLSAYNVIYLSYTIGTRTIMSFKCQVWFLTLIWVFASTFIFLLVAIPFQFSNLAKYIRHGPEYERKEEDINYNQWDPLQERPIEMSNVSEEGSSRANIIRGSRQPGSTRKFLLREVTSGLSQRDAAARANNAPDFEVWMAGFLNLSTFLAAFHIILGTCWFSSILFLSPLDAIRIIMRFFGSAVACRLILMIELAGLRGRA